MAKSTSTAWEFMAMLQLTTAIIASSAAGNVATPSGPAHHKHPINRPYRAALARRNRPQTKLRLAVSTVYYAVYHALARSNADLLMGPSKTEGSTPEWDRVDKVPGGDTAYDLMQADCSDHPEAVGGFADAFLAVHHQRLLAEEDPATTFTTAEARDWIGRAEIAMAEFRSIETGQRKAFAVQLLAVQPSEN